MTTYLGYEVLDQVTHNRRDPRPVRFARRFELVDQGTGAREADDHAGFPVLGQVFRWSCTDRSAVNTLRAFLTARKGKAVPFWVPSFERNFRLTTVILSGATSLTVEASGYGQYVYPAGRMRRHVRLQAAGLPTLFREITGVTDPEDGTEILSLSAAIPAQYPAETLISYLYFCRLESDDVEILWRGKGVAEAEIPMVDLGREYPAT